ncbi:MAG: PHP domain-containing protein [Bacteroidales bacterium]|nr:PHP domain-containing protein [Bacteroidales bacterium]
MGLYRADLHIHSVLSPCGDLEMSPVNIVSKAKAVGLDIVAITDHNSTLHCPLVVELAQKVGILAVCGAEITTKEEVHCVCLVENEEARIQLQQFIEENMQRVPNNPDIFGYQVVVNEQEEILHEVDYLLLGALSKGINEVEAFVHSIGGLFIPAHADRPKYSITSQLGFVPPDLNYDALELSRHTTVEKFLSVNPFVTRKRFIRSSDAHMIDQIGAIYTDFDMTGLSFSALKAAILNLDSL